MTQIIKLTNKKNREEKLSTKCNEKTPWHNANSAEIEQIYFHVISPLPPSLSSSVTGTKQKDGPTSENEFVYF